MAAIESPQSHCYDESFANVANFIALPQMTDRRKTTKIDIGRIATRSGAISVSYSPEEDTVICYCNDPKDLRLRGILLSFSRTELEELRSLLKEVDSVRLEEEERRPDSEAETFNGPAAIASQDHQPSPVRATRDGRVEVTTSSGPVYIQSEEYERFSQQVAKGDEFAAHDLAMKIAGLGIATANEIVERLVRYQRSPMAAINRAVFRTDSPV